MKKCDEQVKIRDEQARGAKMEGKMRADFFDRRTGYAGYTGGLWEWLGYDGLEGQRPRLTHFSATGGALQNLEG